MRMGELFFSLEDFPPKEALPWVSTNQIEGGSDGAGAGGGRSMGKLDCSLVDFAISTSIAAGQLKLRRVLSTLTRIMDLCVLPKHRKAHTFTCNTIL